MTWHTPTLLELVLLAGLAYRLTRLAGWDDITATLRGWLTIPDAFYPHVAGYVAAWRAEAGDPWAPEHRWATGHQAREGEEPSALLYPVDPITGELLGFLILDYPMPSPRRFYAAQLTRCPWCAGYWLSVLTTLAWWAAPSATLLAGTIGTLSTVVGLTRKHLDKGDES